MSSISAPNSRPCLTFRWEKHEENVLKSLKSLRTDGLFTDVMLAAEGKYLSAHRVILSAYSSYFEELLSLHMDHQPILVLQDVLFEELQLLVDFMYTGEIEIEYAKIQSFFDTAQSLKIRYLMQQQGPEETVPSAFLRVPKLHKEAECHAKDSCRSGEEIVQQVHNRLPSIDSAVDVNSLSGSPDEIQTEDLGYALESESLHAGGSDNEENSMTIEKEEVLIPRYESFYPEGVLINATASSEPWKFLQSFKQEPKSFDVQDFNHIPSPLSNNSPSSARSLPKLSAKSRGKQTRMRRVCSEKLSKAQGKRKVSKMSPVVGKNGNNGDLDDETSSATSQFERIEVPELPAARFQGSGTKGNEANALKAKGPSEIANPRQKQGISNASSSYSLRKRTSAVSLQLSKTGSLPDLCLRSTSESGAAELCVSASVSSPVQSEDSRPTSRTTSLGNTPHFECQQCSKVYGTHQALRKHQRLYYGKKLSFACISCDKEFNRKSEVERHRFLHTSAKFRCRRCSKS